MTAQKPIAPTIAFFLLWNIVPVIAVDLNNQVAIGNQEITDKLVYGGLMNIYNIQRVKKFFHCQLWLANKRSSFGVVPIEREVMASNRTVSSSIKSVLCDIKTAAAFLTNYKATSTARHVAAFDRTKPLACIIGWLKDIATGFTKAGRTTGSYAFAFTRTEAARSRFAAMIEYFAAYLTGSCWIAPTSARASYRTKPLPGAGFASYYSATMGTGDLT